MQIAVLAILAVGVAGCGLAQAERSKEIAHANHDRMAAAQTEAAACDDRRKSGELHTFVGAATCANDALMRGRQDTHYPYMDIAYSVQATRLRVAEGIDAGRITETEGRAKIADAMAWASGEDRRRREATRAANAQADAQQPQNYLQMMQTGAAMVQPGPTVTCTTYGNVTTCH